MKNLTHFRSFFKFIGKHKIYTFIEVFGLSVSLMFVILIAAYVVHELSVDRSHTKRNRIVVLADEKVAASNYHLSYLIKDRYPEIENVTSMNTTTNSPVNIAGKRFNSNLMFADTTFFDFFDFRFIAGSPQNFRRMNDAVITRTFANRAFPNEDPIGHNIRINDSINLTVNGVIADPQGTSFPKFDIVLPMQNHRWGE